MSNIYHYNNNNDNFSISNISEQPLQSTNIEEKIEKCNCNQIIAKPLYTLPTGILGECPICYEQLEMVNLTISRCGHSFHSSCVFSSLELSSDSCPLCRIQLVEKKKEEEIEVEEVEEEEEEVEEGEIREVSLEELTSKLMNMGYTPVDLMFLYMGSEKLNCSESNRLKYRDEGFLERFYDDISNICGRW